MSLTITSIPQSIIDRHNTHITYYNTGTCDFTDDFVFDGAAERYALDADMAQHLKDVNPEAFRNVIKRMLEANGRGMWNPPEDVLARLQDLYEEAEDAVEGVSI